MYATKGSASGVPQFWQYSNYNPSQLTPFQELYNDKFNTERKALIENNDVLDSPFVIRIRSFITASKDCRHCLLLVKFPLQKTDIDELNSTIATDRAPLYPSWKACKARPVTLAQVEKHGQECLYSDDFLNKVTRVWAIELTSNGYRALFFLKSVFTPFAPQKISIQLCPNLFRYGQYTLINTNMTFICAEGTLKNNIYICINIQNHQKTNNTFLWHSLVANLFSLLSKENSLSRRRQSFTLLDNPFSTTDFQ